MTQITPIVSGLINITAGIGWDPEIRGFLTVLLAATALMGSVWLLLATNTGVRLGSLVALAGFFGWFTIMSVTWWIFGIGYTGQRPSWEFVESVRDPIGAESTGLEQFINLPDPNCDTGRIFPVAKTGWSFSPPANGCTPRAIALILEFDGPSRSAVISEFATIDTDGIRRTIVSRNSLLELSDPRFLNPAEVDAEVARQVDQEEKRIDQVSLSNLASTAPEVIRWANANNYLTLEDWRLLATTDAGEASNSASAIISSLELFRSNPDAVTPDFLILDAYQKGGKSRPKSDGIWDRVTNRIATTFQVTHPPNEVVIQARGVIPKPQVFGQAAPLAEVDADSDTISIVLRRNLGNLRLTPALLALGSGLIFTALALMLHIRHRREEESEPAALSSEEGDA